MFAARHETERMRRQRPFDSTCNHIRGNGRTRQASHPEVKSSQSHNWLATSQRKEERKKERKKERWRDGWMDG
eukprot:763373-Hanusia_phi.AAC.10